jgi:alkanesulfonate monooxygenase SsuD/methylene tetrahydromethanopterin reductase-like flavin-dependent oxidoreductase (luciferase family)
VIVGSVQEVREELARYRNKLGMNLVVARPQVSGADEGERRLSFDLLAGEVIPALA